MFRLFAVLSSKGRFPNCSFKIYFNSIFNLSQVQLFCLSAKATCTRTRWVALSDAITDVW